MAKEKEDKVFIIPANEYREDLEKKVGYYKAIAEKPRFISKKKYTPNVIPTKFRDKREELDFWGEELRRMVHGYDGLCGKGYSWLNYAKIRALKGGKITPQFRSAQEGWFQTVENLGVGDGIVGYKRRRFGFSWLEAWDVLHDCLTKPYYQVGMNSKSETDSRRLFGFVKFIYQNLPKELRARASFDRRDYMEFAYWFDLEKQKIVALKGLNTEKRGLQSWINSTPPTDNGHEGQAYHKLLIDEAGKIVNLLAIWGFAEDCLLDNTERVGIPIILGTVGDIDKDGAGLREMYNNSDSYGLSKFAIHGYNGLLMDEFGNDMIEEAIRWIIYERDKRKNQNKKAREAFIQKYPLDSRDAFNYVSTGGVGNIELIHEQRIRLEANPVEARTGWMRPKPGGGVDFVPNTEGKIIVYDIPDPRKINGYSAGGDPADHDDVKKTRDSSDLALAIVAKPFGTEPPKLVLEYVDRPEKLDAFFEQSAMALQWYNNTKVLIEDNRARMVNYFKANYPHLLPLVPKSLTTAYRGAVEMANSIKMTEPRRQQIMGLIEDNVDNYSKFIPSIRLLSQFLVFGDDHADDDLAMAYGLALLMMQADNKAVKVDDGIPKSTGVALGWKNGRLVQISGNKPMTPQRRSHPILFGKY